MVRERKIAERMEKETVDCVLLFECNELKIITFLWILVWEFILFNTVLNLLLPFV